jgi:hypothetical protein
MVQLLKTTNMWKAAHYKKTPPFLVGIFNCKHTIGAIKYTLRSSCCTSHVYYSSNTLTTFLFPETKKDKNLQEFVEC